MDNKLKIGLLVDDSDNIFTTEIWRGASYAAGKLDVNLVVFFGGFVGSSNIYGNSRYEFQKNTTYKFSKTKDLDLLIISVSSIVHGNNRLKELFVKEFEGVPIVTLNHKFGNNSLVTFDNAKGIEDAVTSLIQEQQCRKIGMIAGPYENKGSDERLAAYKKTLKSHGIVIDEKRIIHTATFERGYPEYAKKLLDLNPDLDAIVCASDNLAFDAYQVLKERGIRIGEDVKVVGFDDVQEASKVNPPLATIRAEAAQLGFYAVMDGVLSLRGEIPAEFTTLVDVDFIKRDSAAKVGYLEERLYRQIVNYTKSDKDKIVNILMEYIFNNNHSIFIIEARKCVIDLVTFLVELHNDDLFEEKTYTKFSNLIQELIDLDSVEFIDLKRILKVIDVVSQRLSDYRNNLSIIHFNQKILQIIGMHYNTILSERTRISCEEKRLVNILSRGMLSVRNEYDNYNTIFECLKQLNIGNARLYLYEKPITSYMTQFTVLPNEVILKGSIINGKIIIPDDKILVKTDRIFSEKRLFSNCNEYVVNSVYSGTTQYGIFVCDLKYRDFVDLDFVSSQLGTVVNTINLVEKLDNLSKHDELTGLWNRRGFIDKVQGYMNINKGALIFVDLDGLKIINDTYGHEGGDEAIITGAKILKDAFDEFGVIGRIGGDEFAVFLPNQSDFALSEIDQLINDKTIYHNTLIKRNFKVELSYGISLFDQYQDLTVRELLDKADREMYCHKRNKKGNRRKKDVF